MSTEGGNNFDKTVNEYLGFLDNEYIAAGLSLFLILYAAVIAPKLSPQVMQWFDNWLVQVAMFFAIVYISNKNVTVALIASIAVLVTLMIVNNQSTIRQMIDMNMEEGFSSCGCSKSYDDYMDDDVYEDMNGNNDDDNYDDNGDNADDTVSDNGSGYQVAPLGDINGIDAVDGLACPLDDDEMGKMTDKDEPEYPTHQRYMDQVENDIDTDDSTDSADTPTSKKQKRKDRVMRKLMSISNIQKVNGMDETLMDDGESGYSLNGSSSVGTTNAGANQVDSINRKRSQPKTVTSYAEAVKIPVEHISAQIERETGRRVTKDEKKSVANEVVREVNNRVKNGKSVTQDEVVYICQAVFQARM